MKQELLALKWAITEKLCRYLLCSKFTVITDNNPLCYLKTINLHVIEQRWTAQLSVFDFDVQYRPGQNNIVVDTLSRQLFAGELELASEFKGCVAICNLMNRGTALDSELVTAALKSGKVRQIRIAGTSQKESLELAQSNTPTLSGFSIEEL